MATAGAADSGTYLPKVDRATVQGPIMRWSQNEWKDNWMVLDIATKTLTVHRSEHRYKNKHTPRVCMESAEISVDQQSIRRFTIDDGAMMIYFRTNDQARPARLAGRAAPRRGGLLCPVTATQERGRAPTAQWVAGHARRAAGFAIGRPRPAARTHHRTHDRTNAHCPRC